MALLELEDVHTYYGEAHILQGVSLTVGEGEVVSLIGRNGAGKTTTLRSVMGVARPARGRVRLRGEDLTRRPTHEIVRRGIAWIPEERRVLPNLTEILAAINRGGTTILLVEQTLEVALALSRRVYVMDQGRIQFQGTPEALRKDPTIQQRFLEV